MVPKWVGKNVTNAQAVGPPLGKLQHTKIDVSLICKAIHGRVHM